MENNHRQPTANEKELLTNILMFNIRVSALTLGVMLGTAIFIATNIMTRILKYKIHFFCAAALIFGNKAMYIKNAKRSHDNRNNVFPCQCILL